MTNAGVNGYPSTTGSPPDGSINPGKLASPFVVGKLVSGFYYITASQSSGGTTSSTLGNGTLRLLPWVVPNACTLSRIGAAVTSTGESNSKIRLGIYADNGSCYPGTLVLDAGQIAGDSATAQELTINQVLTPGVYWVGGAVQAAPSSQPTVTVAPGSPPFIGPMPVGTSTPSTTQAFAGYTQSSVSGALPYVFTSTLGLAGSAPRVFVKVQ